MDAASSSASRINASDLNGPVDPAMPTDYSHEDRRQRRASPSYDGPAQGRQQANGNSNSSSGWRRLTPERPLSRYDDGHAQGRSDRHSDYRPQRSHYGGNRGGGGNADFFASRQAERDASTFSIWPPSPKTPRNEESEDERDRRKRKKDKKHRSHKSSHSKKKKRYSSETESDSEDDDKHRRSKKHRSSKNRHSDDMSDSEYERERRRRKEKKHRSRSRSRTVERIHNDQEDEWAEKGTLSTSEKGAVPGTSLVPSTAGADKSGLTSSKGKGKETGGNANASDSDSDDVGPKPLAETIDKHNPKDFGGALLRGEGAAMAAFVAEGARIPRRGEIGLESDQILKYEDAGYVMSGSRHRRMNAVRMRKENQVITAEEKRQLLKTQKEEQDKKETMVVSSFKELLEQRLQGEKRKQRDNY